MLSHIQGESADVWRENIIEELEIGEVEYKSVNKFFTILKKEFREGEEESMKVAELRKLEQGGRIMEKYRKTTGRRI